MIFLYSYTPTTSHNNHNPFLLRRGFATRTKPHFQASHLQAWTSICMSKANAQRLQAKSVVEEAEVATVMEVEKVERNAAVQLRIRCRCRMKRKILKMSTRSRGKSNPTIPDVSSRLGQPTRSTPRWLSNICRPVWSEVPQPLSHTRICSIGKQRLYHCFVLFGCIFVENASISMQGG